jgi:hypothetical protein
MKMNTKLVALVFMGAFIVSAGLSLGVSLNPQDTLLETEDPDTDDTDDGDEVDEDDGDEDDDDIDDDYEDEHGRVVKVENGTDEIKLESELKTGDRKDQFTVKVHAGDDLGIKLEYESESETALGEETELEIEFKVVFKSLIEFVDIDGDGLYNTSVDEEIQVYRLDDFSPIVYDPQVQPDLSTLHYLNVSTTDGVFTAHIFVAGEFMDMGATILTPTQVKIDIEILNFTYWNDNSQLALYTKLESDYEVEEEEQTEDERLGFSPAASESGLQSEMNGFMAGFTWAEQADVDGIMKDVFVTSLDSDDVDPNDDKMYIIYPRGTRIYHDPKICVLGIMDDPNALNIPGYPLWALFAGSIAIISMLAISKRKFQ